MVTQRLLDTSDRSLGRESDGIQVSLCVCVWYWEELRLEQRGRGSLDQSKAKTRRGLLSASSKHLQWGGQVHLRDPDPLDPVC